MSCCYCYSALDLYSASRSVSFLSRSHRWVGDCCVIMGFCFYVSVITGTMSSSGHGISYKKYLFGRKRCGSRMSRYIVRQSPTRDYCY